MRPLEIAITLRNQMDRVTEDSADVWQDQPLAKSMANGISPEASKAARLMLDRLKELSEISDGGSVETTLLCVPENKREHVLSVLETLSGRAPKTNTEDPLASAARLVRNAALELWAKPSHDEVETNLERLATTDYALRALRCWRAVRLGVRHKYARATAAAGRADNLGTCECRKTVEVDSGVARPGAAARVVAETSNASPRASWALSCSAPSASSSSTRVLLDVLALRRWSCSPER